jgi:hypothetical protein
MGRQELSCLFAYQLFIQTVGDGKVAGDDLPF